MLVVVIRVEVHPFLVRDLVVWDRDPGTNQLEGICSLLDVFWHVSQNGISHIFLYASVSVTQVPDRENVLLIVVLDVAMLWH